MSGYSTAQLALVVIGLVLWGYGVRAEFAALRWAGIACFAVAAILRFVRRWRRTPDR